MNDCAFFFFSDTASPEIYTLSLHDALPIWVHFSLDPVGDVYLTGRLPLSATSTADIDRKSTRLNSSHVEISYAVFCLKKKKIKNENTRINYGNVKRAHHTVRKRHNHHHISI